MKQVWQLFLEPHSGKALEITLDLVLQPQKKI